MTFREFYAEAREITQHMVRNDMLYLINHKYNIHHKSLLELIEELEKAQGKSLDNLRYKYLPKKLDFDCKITTAVVSTNRRFINQNAKYEDQIKQFGKGHFIGYWTTVKKVMFYDMDQRSLGQFGIPKKGVLIEQEQEIEVIENQSIRQKRSDAKYDDLVFVREIKIEGEILPKQVWKHKAKI